MQIPTQTGTISDERIITSHDLLSYCYDKDIGADEYYHLTRNIPLGVNLLRELKNHNITSKYIKYVERKAKLKKLIDEN